MTKKDLRSGMVVETREGERYLVLTDKQYFIGKNCYMEYCSHNDDLTYRNGKFDIMKVYAPYVKGFNGMLDEPGIPIWERPTYFNGKVVCIEARCSYLTKGKIYTFEDGAAVDDFGDQLPSWVDGIESVEHLNESMFSKFIEVVE